MLKYLKNKIVNFVSYISGLEEKLKNAKNDTERANILTQIAEAQKEQIERLSSENAELKEENVKLKERIKEQEELESILSSGSSVSSAEGIDSNIDRQIKEIETKIINSKKSTAPERKMIRLLKSIKKLKEQNQRKDLRIKELEEKGKTSIDLTNLRSKVLKLKSSVSSLQEAVIETPNKK